MAILGDPIPVPDFDLDFEAEIKWSEENIYKEYRGRIIRFPVADGYAEYVVDDDDITLHHIPTGDAYRAHPALIRGLLTTEVKQMLQREKQLDQMFGRR